MGNIFSGSSEYSSTKSYDEISNLELDNNYQINNYITNTNENYENVEQEFKELLYVIEETNDIMHFFKSIKDVHSQDFKEFKTFSLKSLKYFEYFKDSLFEEYETKILDVDIKNYYDMSIFVNNAYYYYHTKTPEYKKKYLLEMLFNLLHSTLYFLIKDDLIS